MQAEFGVEIVEALPNPEDPPDCFVRIGRRRLGVEVTELVDRPTLARAKMGESPSAGALFLDAQWSRDRFLSTLSATMMKKGDRY